MDRLLAPLERLLRIAKQPECQSQINTHGHSRLLSVEPGQGTMLRGVIERGCLLKSLARLSQLSKVEQGPAREQLAEHRGGVSSVLGHAQKFFSKRQPFPESSA